MTQYVHNLLVHYGLLVIAASSAINSTRHSSKEGSISKQLEECLTHGSCSASHQGPHGKQKQCRGARA